MVRIQLKVGPESRAQKNNVPDFEKHHSPGDAHGPGTFLFEVFGERRQSLP